MDGGACVRVCVSQLKKNTNTLIEKTLQENYGGHVGAADRALVGRD